jgi:hypothetical protein
MFRSDAQTSLCCRALLASVRLERLWPKSGPTDEAVKLLGQDGGYLSSGERAMLFACFALWNSDKRATLAGMFSLDPDRQRDLWSLLLAQATLNDQGAAVDAWLLERGIVGSKVR